MKLEIYVAYATSPDEWSVGDDEQTAVEKFNEEWTLETALNVIKLELEIADPKPLTLKGVIPASAVSQVVELTVSKPA